VPNFNENTENKGDLILLTLQTKFNVFCNTEKKWTLQHFFWYILDSWYKLDAVIRICIVANIIVLLFSLFLDSEW
jgi:hypothetical protein